MKNQLSYSSKIGLSVLCGALGSVAGIERPGDLTEGAAPAEIVSEKVEKVEGKVADKPVAQKLAFLGVSGNPVSEDLAWHLNLESGLQLDFILKDSPADLAGLTERDIVTSIDEKVISSQDDLRAAVQLKSPGDEISLKLVRRGRPIVQKVTLSGREVMPPQAHRVNPFPADEDGRADLQRFLDQQFGDLPGNIPDLEIQRQLLKEVEKAWGLNDGNGPQQLKLELNDLLDQKVGVKAAGSVMFQDQEGSVEMRMIEGKREITIRGADGEILFEGPYDSDVDKAAVPEEFQERVEKLGLDKQGGGRMFHFEFNNRKEKK